MGLYGLVGAGRTELARAIIGADEIVAGEVLVAGQPARIGSVAEALGRYRIGYVSEDRKDEGLILIHSVLKNITVTVWHRLQNAVRLDHHGLGEGQGPSRWSSGWTSRRRPCPRS